MPGVISARPASLIAATLSLTVTVVAGPLAEAAGQADPGVSLKIVTFGEERARLQSTPIEQRPYRPLHVYGNSVRRQHRRSQSVRPSGSAPAARSVGQAGGSRTSS